MTLITEIIDRKDRDTVYYNSAPMIRRYQRMHAGRRRAAARAAAAAKIATEKATVATAAARAARRARIRNRGRTRARTKGGVNGTSSHFISQTGYHTASAKQARRSARQTEARRLSVKKYGRYSQLM